MGDLMSIPPVLQDSFGAVTMEDLTRLERELHITLPTSYCDFVRRQNGGRFAQMTTGGTKRKTHVSFLYSITRGFEDVDLSATVRANKWRFGRGYFPFGNSGLGEFLLLRSRSAKDSPVFALDYATGERVLVSGNLKEFFQSITYSPQQEELWTESEPPFTLIERGHVSALADFKDLLALKSKSGQLPLACAAASLQPRVVEYLLHLGANPNELGDDWMSPLMLAAENGGHEICRRLLEFGADPTSKGPDGMTALDFAVRDELPRVRALLEDAMRK